MDYFVRIEVSCIFGLFVELDDNGGVEMKKGWRLMILKIEVDYGVFLFEIMQC